MALVKRELKAVALTGLFGIEELCQHLLAWWPCERTASYQQSSRLPASLLLRWKRQLGHGRLILFLGWILSAVQTQRWCQCIMFFFLFFIWVDHHLNYTIIEKETLAIFLALQHFTSISPASHHCPVLCFCFFVNCFSGETGNDLVVFVTVV